MPSSLPITPPSGRAAPPGGSPKAAGPPGARGDFASLLSQTSARTASAEGPKTRPAQSDQPQRRDDRARPGRQDDAHRVDASVDAQARTPAAPADAPVSDPVPAAEPPAAVPAAGPQPATAADDQ